MHRSRQALCYNVLEGESTKLPEHFEVDKSHAIITSKIITLYAVLDKVSDQRLGCIVVDKSALRTNKEVAQFRTVLGNHDLFQTTRFSHVSYCRVWLPTRLCKTTDTYYIFMQRMRTLTASICWSLSAKAVHCLLQTVM